MLLRRARENIMFSVVLLNKERSWPKNELISANFPCISRVASCAQLKHN